MKENPIANLFKNEALQDAREELQEKMQELFTRDDKGEDVEGEIDGAWAQLKELGRKMGIK